MDSNKRKVKYMVAPQRKDRGSKKGKAVIPNREKMLKIGKMRIEGNRWDYGIAIEGQDRARDLEKNSSSLVFPSTRL